MLEPTDEQDFPSPLTDDVVIVDEHTDIGPDLERSPQARDQNAPPQLPTDVVVGEDSSVTVEQENLTNHVTNVLDGTSAEQDQKKEAVLDINIILRSLKIIIMMHCSSLLQYLKKQAIRYTNNEQLRPVRVIIKNNYAVMKKHHEHYIKPFLKLHGKIVWSSTMIISAWLTFYILYISLFNYDYLELSYTGELGAPPVHGPFYKRNVNIREKKKLKELSMKKHRFNSFLSDQLPLNRDIADTRSYGCSELMYPHKLPTASVIIVFHNEALTVLLRTVHSVINRTPPHLLHEVILVDDFSDSAELKTLDYEISKVVKTRHIRVPKRSGLIKARLFGAAQASGQVMIFLDSHCEANKGWIEPLLYEVYKDRRTVPSPIIDVIHFESFDYMQAVPQVGAFDWSFTFYWQILDQGSNLTEPLIAPVMAGGLFAIDRGYFEEIGTYDTEMNIWGGENMEMSFRVWMCGGRLLSLPCSRVGHIFRDSAPYNFPDGQLMTLYKNYARAVEVWLDQHKALFYRFVPLAKDVDVGDISSRLSLRRKLKCNTFDWYLENLLPMLPTEKRLMASGQIRNSKTNQCVDTLGKRNANDTVSHYRCLPKREAAYTSQVWMYSKRYEIISLENCLDASVPDPGDTTFKRVTLFPCHGLGGNQKWYYSPTQQIIHSQSQLCLTVGDPNKAKLFLSKCDGSGNQMFSFTNIYEQDDFEL